MKTRPLVIVVGAVFALLAPSAPALAAPELGIEMTHANAYGLQASQCPTGKEENFPGEPKRDCGVDPFTGSGTTFSLESGFNTYTIIVRNVAQRSAGPGPGTTLSCETGTWEEGPTFSYSWLRNGKLIPGAESSEYTLTNADEGASVQCLVTASNASGATAQATNAVDVVPVPTTVSPGLEGSSTVRVPGESSTFVVGETRECEHEAWTGSPTFAYRWLRDGVPIAGAVGKSYTLTASDLGTAVQCQVIAANAGGVVVADNPFPSPVGTSSPVPFPPFYNTGPTIPVTGALSNETTGSVIVADQLPAGLEAIGTAAEPAASGAGWTCTTTSVGRGVSCTNPTPLPPGGRYAPIALHVHVTGEAPTGAPPTGGVTNTVAVSGGGSTSNFTSDATEVRPAVPFGIESFATSVTDSLGAPLTQAASHPFAATATIAFNHTPEIGGRLMTAGGSPKDVESELPPGFVGNPQDAPTCTAAELETGGATGEHCPAGAAIGFTTAILKYGEIEGGKTRPFGRAPGSTLTVFNLTPPPGDAASFGFVDSGSFFALDARVRSDGDYGITLGDTRAGRDPSGMHGLTAVSLTICGFGVTGHESNGAIPTTLTCAAPAAGVRPFLTTPSACAGPAPVTTVLADTYENPADYVSKTVFNGAHLTGDAPSATESFATGCEALQFAPTIEFGPTSGVEGGTSEADRPTGARFDLRVPQAPEEAAAHATPELKDATVTLPEGMSANPAAAGGLQACSATQFGLGSTVEPAEPADCPTSSQIGTVEVCTPLLANRTGKVENGEQVDRECEEGKAVPVLQGQVFVGAPECSPCSASDVEAGKLFRLFLQVRAPERGVIVKLAGKVSANPLTGRLQATFAKQPQVPFGELRMKLEGGPRAPLATPQSCGTAQTSTVITPWSAPGVGGVSGGEPIAGTPDATPSASFDVDWDGSGGACPATMPFGPSFSAGTQSSAAGGSSPLAVTFGREDREQNLSGVTVSTPEGLLGRVSQASQCSAVQADAGTCPASAQIGTATVAAGAGPDPYYLSGEVYLTGPYKGAPFGLSVAVPAEAGPFKLAGNTGDGLEVVRAAIAVNPSTAALTIVSDALPQVVDGVPLRLRQVHVEVDRAGFIVNPTSCAPLSIGATLTGSRGASASVSSPFGPTGCGSLPFHPSLVARTSSATSKATGASLVVTVTSAPGEANIGKVDLALPKALPSRLTTLQKACVETQFAANPAGCPAGSNVGTATAHTPLLNSPLTGPVYLVSHGGAAFPDAEFVLQGENGLEIVIDAHTQIKHGITYSRFETVPDAPITSFETTLPQGPHSIFGANENLCTAKGLDIGATLTGQNGAQTIKAVQITVTGCEAASLTRAQKLKRALAACRTRYKGKSRKTRRRRAACDRLARERYGTTHAKQSARKSSHGKGGSHR